MRIKNYLSYSQYQAFNSGQYTRIYLDGIKLNNSGLKFGSEFAEMMESEEMTGDEIELVKIQLPTPQYREKKFNVMWEDIPMFGSLDGFDEDPLIVHEYKTGTTKWTQSKVDKAEQLTFYALYVWLTYKKIPKIKLYWIETEKIDEEIRLTGNIKVFDTERKLTDFIKLYSKVKKAWIGIEKLIDEYAG